MPSTQLPDFESRNVRKATLRLTNAGDGLSEALSLAPKAWHVDDTVFLVVRAKVTQVNHRPEKEDDEDLVRVHTAKAEEVIEVAAADVETYLSEARDRTRIARDAAAGQAQLDMAPSRKADLRVEKD